MNVSEATLDFLDKATSELGAGNGSPKWMLHLHNQLTAYNRALCALYNKGQHDPDMIASVKSGIARQLDERKIPSAVRSLIEECHDSL